MVKREKNGCPTILVDSRITKSILFCGINLWQEGDVGQNLKNRSVDIEFSLNRFLEFYDSYTNILNVSEYSVIVYVKLKNF